VEQADKTNAVIAHRNIKALSHLFGAASFMLIVGF
jgi:hypothetical protein